MSLLRTILHSTRALSPAAGLALLAVAVPALAPTAARAASDDPVHLDFGVYGSDEPPAMVRTFKPTLNRLEESVGERLGREVDIRMRIARDYDEGIADLIEGRVDFSHFGPSSYIEAKRKNPGLGILATTRGRSTSSSRRASPCASSPGSRT